MAALGDQRSFNPSPATHVNPLLVKASMSGQLCAVIGGGVQGEMGLAQAEESRGAAERGFNRLHNTLPLILQRRRIRGLQ